ncbi:Ger(x)C family spore germination protein [Paenibacillus sedimenti]|uniref:Ger(X)C family spore germination protein n=1 Tax=Paenibacillus sedimenti TaxID=2770274 RepID=A0A926QJ03_9BACL|nr:Ger(x)C family spore germination protein [Paenibacillus sedimenti]MBD0381055.1 Ger(x)C family spore germination protein [Paenibacillus sedimenti]
MKAKQVIRIVVILWLVLPLTGCWNRRELKELAFVAAMGIDKTPKVNEYKVSFQIINPGSVALGATGGAGGQPDSPITVYSGTGKSLFEAIRKTSQKVPRQLFFSHMQVLIIGEPLAKEGIQDLFDFFERSHEIRLTTMVLIARGSEAEPLVKMLTPLEKIPANAIAGKIKMTSKIWSENIKVEMDDVIRPLVSQGEPMISGVNVIGDQEVGKKTLNVQQSDLSTKVNISGIAIFKNGKLKGWLDGDEGRGALWIRNKMKSTVIDLDCKDKKDAVGIEIIRSHTNVEVEIQNGKPVFHIHIRETGNLSEIKCSLDLTKVEEITNLEKQLAAETKKEVLEAVKAAQNEESDIFGFGEAVNRANAKAWNKMKKEWGKTFAESKVDVEVDAFIRRSGMRIKPYISEQEGTSKE